MIFPIKGTGNAPLLQKSPYIDYTCMYVYKVHFLCTLTMINPKWRCLNKLTSKRLNHRINTDKEELENVLFKTEIWLLWAFSCNVFPFPRLWSTQFQLPDLCHDWSRLVDIGRSIWLAGEVKDVKNWCKNMTPDTRWKPLNLCFDVIQKWSKMGNLTMCNEPRNILIVLR